MINILLSITLILKKLVIKLKIRSTDIELFLLIEFFHKNK